MEVKDLIRELRAIYTCSLKEAIDVSGYDLEKYKETFNQVESTIIKLGKYKQMWSELEGEFWSRSNKDKLHMNFEDFSELLTSIVQKYLKEANPDEAGKAKDNRK